MTLSWRCSLAGLIQFHITTSVKHTPPPGLTQLSLSHGLPVYFIAIIHVFFCVFFRHVATILFKIQNTAISRVRAVMFEATAKSLLAVHGCKHLTVVAPNEDSWSIWDICVCSSSARQSAVIAAVSYSYFIHTLSADDLLPVATVIKQSQELLRAHVYIQQMSYPRKQAHHLVYNSGCQSSGRRAALSGITMAISSVNVTVLMTTSQLKNKAVNYGCLKDIRFLLWFHQHPLVCCYQVYSKSYEQIFEKKDLVEG